MAGYRLLIVMLIVACFVSSLSSAQDANRLLEGLRSKLKRVKNYEADGYMKTDVSFINIPDSKVKVYFQQPDKFKIEKPDGISILPKGGVSVSLNSLLSDKEFTAVPSGYTTIDNRKLAIIKLLPVDENSDVVLMTLYVDEDNLLVYKLTTTTKDYGSFETNLQYGKYASWGLPDQVQFIFNTNTYKMPKAVTMEYEANKKNETKSQGNGKGKVSISYERYIINRQ